MRCPEQAGEDASRAGCLQVSPYLPARSRLPGRLGRCSHDSQGLAPAPGAGDVRETWGLSRQWGCRQPSCWESCLGLGTLLELQETSLNPAKAKGNAKREGHLRNGCFVVDEGRKYFGGSVCSQRSTVGTL